MLHAERSVSSSENQQTQFHKQHMIPGMECVRKPWKYGNGTRPEFTMPIIAIGIAMAIAIALAIAIATAASMAVVIAVAMAIP